MASKSRKEDDFTIHLSHLEMLKLERLMRRLVEIDNANPWEYLKEEEPEWASNAQQLFTPELPSGGYEI